MADQPFSRVKNNIFNRHFGGQWDKAEWSSDPYVTGYHFIRFDKLPDIYTNDKMEKDDMISLLSACCTGVTPPGGTLTNVEFTGLGGIKWGVPGGVDYGNSISVKYIEMDGTPIYKINHSWFKMIRDYRLGISVGKKEGANEYVNSAGSHSKEKYAGILYYWTTAPDGQTTEYCACYDGIYPTKDPQDSFSSDVETIGRLDLDIEYHLDFIWTESWVNNKIDGFRKTTEKGSLSYSTQNFLDFSL